MLGDSSALSKTIKLYKLQTARYPGANPVKSVSDLQGKISASPYVAMRLALPKNDIDVQYPKSDHFHGFSLLQASMTVFNAQMHFEALLDLVDAQGKFKTEIEPERPSFASLCRMDHPK